MRCMAGNKSWPIGEKEYDLFVALQVFEHLGDWQTEAFGEVSRVASQLSVRFRSTGRWTTLEKAPTALFSNERALSWFAPTVPNRVVLGNTGPASVCCTCSRTFPAKQGSRDGST